MIWTTFCKYCTFVRICVGDWGFGGCIEHSEEYVGLYIELFLGQTMIRFDFFPAHPQRMIIVNKW